MERIRVEAAHGKTRLAGLLALDAILQLGGGPMAKEKSTVKRARNRRMKLRVEELEEALRVTQAYLLLLFHRAQADIRWGQAGLPERDDVERALALAQEQLDKRETTPVEEKRDADQENIRAAGERSAAGGYTRGFHAGTSN